MENTDSNNAFTTYLSTHYKKIIPNLQQSYEKRFYLWKSYLQSYLPKDKNAKILEVGCGMGHNLYALNRLRYKNITGVDISQECIKYCRSKGFTVKLIKANDFSFYKRNRNKFKIIILYDVLEHISPKEGQKLLSFLRQALSPKGQLIISLPNADHPLSLRLMYADITHKFIYNKSSLSQLLRLSGFTSFEFLQINSFTLDDRNVFKRIFKQTLVRLIAKIGEFFWRFIALTQGIILDECKPTLICIIAK